MTESKRRQIRRTMGADPDKALPGLDLPLVSALDGNAAALADKLESGNWTTIDVHAAARMLRKMEVAGAGRLWIHVGKGVIEPDEGWEPNTYYLVNVKYSPDNVLHRATFYSGFLDDDRQPAGYNTIWSPTYGGMKKELVHAWHLSVVKRLATRQDFEAPDELRDEPTDGEI